MSMYKMTSLSLNEKDMKMQEQLEENGISLIDTWRQGARTLLNRDELKSKKKG